MDTEQLVKEILKNIGENPDREGLKDTPKRVARMHKEIFRGYDKKQMPNVTVFENGHDGIIVDEMICDTGSFNSMCEHHLMPISHGKYYFAYIPNPKGRILGLSKVARIVDYFSARLQIQERLVHQIVDCLYGKLSCKLTQPIGMALVMEAEHLCKSMRGVKKEGMMRTTKLMGAFKDDDKTRSEFLNWVNHMRGE